MREDVEFNADGVTLRGWFYTPDGAGGSVPTIVMAHAMVEHMKKNGVKTVGFLGYTDAYGESWLKDFTAVAMSTPGWRAASASSSLGAVS